MKLRHRRARFVRNPRRAQHFNFKQCITRQFAKFKVNGYFGSITPGEFLIHAGNTEDLSEWMREQLLDEYLSGLDSVT